MTPLPPNGGARNVLLGLAWGVSFASLLSACGNPSAQPAEGAAQTPPALAVSMLEVSPERVPIALEAVGRAEGSREIEIRARVTGIVEKRLYEEGAAVEAGDVLFEIDRAPYEIAVAQARAALAQERARAELARRESERLQGLVETGAISEREYESALAALEESEAAIQGAQAKLAEAELNLSYTRVTAPISGITGRAMRHEGSLVTVNTESTLLTTLTQVDPIWVRFSLAFADYERIRGVARDARVNLLRDDGTVAAGDGHLNFAASTIDAELGTVEMRAEFPNETHRWLPGQFVRVQILAGEQEAFLVPQAAVLQTEQAQQVWIAGEDGTAGLRTVQTAGWIGNAWVVTDGLVTGERVIIDNLMKLRPGAAVRMLSAEATQQADRNVPPRSTEGSEG